MDKDTPEVIPDIPRRKPVLGLPAAAVTGHWYANKRFHSRMGDALSLLFPEGERFFVESVRYFQGQIEDPTLKKAVADFVAQEAAHGRAHRAFNQALGEGGLPMAQELEGELRAVLDFVRRIFGPKSQLAVTCALEHFTALMAEQLMREPEHREAMAPEVRPLWLWHALEESEHKSVAFDVYRAVGGGYWRRVSIMILTTLMFFTMTSRFQRRLIRHEGPLSWAEILEGVDHIWGRKGMMRRLIPDYLAYFRPKFHPTDHDSSALIAWCRAYLYGPGGALAGLWEAA
ncbi:MAG: metal-dependent hydrolase [Myxococcota bacterium]